MPTLTGTAHWAKVHEAAKELCLALAPAEPGEERDGS